MPRTRIAHIAHRREHFPCKGRTPTSATFPTPSPSLLVLADGRGIAHSWKPAGACYDVSAATLGDLEAPEWYDACLALADPAMRRACVTDSFAGDVLCAESYTWQPGPECY